MKLNVISFNILCCDADHGNSIQERAPRLYEVVQPLNADLIGFQEATPAWLKHLERDYGETYELYNVYRAHNNHESTPIAWRKDRFQCLDRGTMWFSDTPEVESLGWDELYHCPRIFSWAKLKERENGTEFCFINTHFGFGDTCQIKSVGIIKDFVRRMACPCVITGDFNMEISASAYQEMATEFRDVNAETANDLSPTYHGFDPERLGEHIDYCFISPKIETVSFRVLREMPGGMYPSDHYGLFAELNL